MIPKKNRKPRGKPPLNAQGGGSSGSGSMEFPPPPQEDDPEQSEAEDAAEGARYKYIQGDEFLPPESPADSADIEDEEYVYKYRPGDEFLSEEQFALQQENDRKAIEIKKENARKKAEKDRQDAEWKESREEFEGNMTQFKQNMAEKARIFARKDLENTDKWAQFKKILGISRRTEKDDETQNAEKEFDDALWAYVEAGKGSLPAGNKEAARAFLKYAFLGGEIDLRLIKADEAAEMKKESGAWSDKYTELYKKNKDWWKNLSFKKKLAYSGAVFAVGATGVGASFATIGAMTLSAKMGTRVLGAGVMYDSSMKWQEALDVDEAEYMVNQVIEGILKKDDWENRIQKLTKEEVLGVAKERRSTFKSYDSLNKRRAFAMALVLPALATALDIFRWGSGGTGKGISAFHEGRESKVVAGSPPVKEPSAGGGQSGVSKDGSLAGNEVQRERFIDEKAKKIHEEYLKYKSGETPAEAAAARGTGASVKEPILNSENVPGKNMHDELHAGFSGDTGKIKNGGSPWKCIRDIYLKNAENFGGYMKPNEALLNRCYDFYLSQEDEGHWLKKLGLEGKSFSSLSPEEKMRIYDDWQKRVLNSAGRKLGISERLYDNLSPEQKLKVWGESETALSMWEKPVHSLVRPGDSVLISEHGKISLAETSDMKSGNIPDRNVSVRSGGVTAADTHGRGTATGGTYEATEKRPAFLEEHDKKEKIARENFAKKDNIARKTHEVLIQSREPLAAARTAEIAAIDNTQTHKWMNFIQEGIYGKGTTVDWREPAEQFRQRTLGAFLFSDQPAGPPVNAGEQQQYWQSAQELNRKLGPAFANESTESWMQRGLQSGKVTPEEIIGVLKNIVKK